MKLFDEATRLLQEMSSKNIKPDVVSYGIIIDSYSHLGEKYRAWKLFYEMEQKWIKPNLVINTFMLDGLLKSH